MAAPTIVTPQLQYVPLLRQAIVEGFAHHPAGAARKLQNDQQLISYLLDPPATGLLPDGRRVRRPRETSWWLVDGENFLGNVSLRHELTIETDLFSGHIGYGVPPLHTGKGYATRLLQHALTEARNLKIPAVLLTIDADNLASIRVVEKCGGKLRDVIDHPYKPGTPHARYWISL